MQVGIGTSNGIGIGKALLLEKQNVEIKVYTVEDIGREKERYNSAKKQFIAKTNSLIEELKSKIGSKSAEILKNQIYLINDIELNSGVESIIENERVCAEAAFDKTCQSFISLFADMQDEVMNQRAVDIEDMRLRLIRTLLGMKEINLMHLPENTVIIAHELVPSVTAIMDTKHIAGIVSEKGGATSHASILARALGIPAVLSVRNAMNIIKDKDTVIVDGIYGEVFINPIPKTLEIYKRKQIEYVEKVNELRIFKDKATLTKDGCKVKLEANIGLPKEVNKMIEAGGEGVGLFRTEFLYMNGLSMPTEEEQFEAYKQAVIMSKGKTVTIRTLDIGGDKEIPYMGLAKECNPFLGYRAIRYCLNRADVFDVQLRAIMRASAYGNIRIMIPFVTSLNEVVQVKERLNSICLGLEEEAIVYDKNVQLGIMIETPAAAVIADILAKEVDFFSIGTNDLVQYAIAVDRGNENVAYLYTPFHPSVLRLIKHIIQCAKRHNITVGMCGEAAGNINMIPLLLAFGLDEFSVTPSNILETRKNIASWTMKEAKEIEEIVMKLCTDNEIIDYLSDVIDKKKEAD